MEAPLPWIAERRVDATLAGRLVTAQFPKLAGAEVTLLAEGWDNTVYVVGGEWVFRFPRRAIALSGVRLETAVLPLLALRLPLPVPVPELIGAPDDAYEWPFWGGRVLPGTDLALTELSDGGRAPLARQLGAFLRALHDPQTAFEVRGCLASAPDSPEGVRVELRVDPLLRADSHAVATRARDRLDRLEAAGLWVSSDASRAVLTNADGLSRTGADATLAAGGPVLVHGDLHLRHVLVTENGHAAGVIDWGDACLADPSVDLSLAYAAFAGSDRAAFFGAYGTITPEQEVRARVLALLLCAALAEHAADTGAAMALRTSLDGLARASRP